jgi:hypothetical protein
MSLSMEKKYAGPLTAELLATLPMGPIAMGVGKMTHPYYPSSTPLKTADAEGKAFVKWVAVRGGICDWAVYHSLDAQFELADRLDGKDHLAATYQDIQDHGSKMSLGDACHILEQVDESAKKLYRD